MSPLKHILAIATVFSCLLSSISVLALSSSSNLTSSNSKSQSSQTSSVSSTISSQQIELADKLPNGKKQLKKPLSLDYTNPKFETEITKPQKEAILKALKKWKGELPVNNTFTITSWADLKTETADSTKQSKKKDKKTENAQVIYMWASTPNTKWDNSKPFDAEDYESGDPRFIRTEFNVLLKQSKKGDWKASLERDTEIKTDSESITESSEDQKVYQDLFGTNKADNLLTATSDVLIDSISLTSAISFSLTSNSTVITSSSFVSSIISNNPSTISNSSQTQPNSNTSSKKVGFLESLLNLGSVKASAGEYDYSWPWKAGDTYSVSQGWHGSGVVGSIDGYDWQESKDYKDIALDINMKGGDSVLAPISGTVYRKCNDSNNATVLIRPDATNGTSGMRLLHLSPNNSFGVNSSDISYKKSQVIGTIKAGLLSSDKGCGYGYGDHLHLKFMTNNMVVDGSTITYGSSYSSFTSQNSTNTTQNVLFRDVNSGNNSIWKFSNTTHTGDTAFPNNVGTVWQVAGFGDFNGDGYQDILWRNTNNGQNVLWEMQNGVITKDWGVISTVGLDFSVAGIGDFNGDGYADILWRNTGGVNVIWNMKSNVKIGDYIVQNVPTDWKVISVADFNNDGKADIFWRNNNGQNVIWNMNNSSIIQNGPDGVEFVDNSWYVAGIADFNGDYKQDIFWRNNNGSNVIWNMNNRAKNASLPFSTVGNDFIVGGLGDFNQDGKADIFWRNQNGQQNVIWNMNNATINANTQVGTTGASNTQVKGIFAK